MLLKTTDTQVADHFHTTCMRGNIFTKKEQVPIDSYQNMQFK